MRNPAGPSLGGGYNGERHPGPHTVAGDLASITPGEEGLGHEWMAPRPQHPPPLIPGGLLSWDSSSGEKAWAGQGWETRDLWRDGGRSSIGCVTWARTGWRGLGWPAWVTSGPGF